MDQDGTDETTILPLEMRAKYHQPHYALFRTPFPCQIFTYPLSVMTPHEFSSIKSMIRLCKSG